MIGRLQGRLIDKRPPWLLIDCHGVGYELEAPMTTIWALPELEQEVILHTHMHLRDDAQRLFGFATLGERRLFRTLLKVSGVGAKMALAILSGIQADDFVACIQQGDVARLTALPGIGKKTAERLIVEMRDRVQDWAAVSTLGAAVMSTPAGDAVSDAVSGLIALGYKPPEASRLVSAADTDGKPSEEIIREVLRGLAKEAHIK